MRRLLKKIPAGALQFSILISIVIASLVMAFILLTYTQIRFSKQLSFAEKTIGLTHSGIAFEKQNAIPYGDSISPDIALDYGTLKLHKTHWGSFDKLIVTSQIRKNKHQKIALMGGVYSDKTRPAIYLSDRNMPLVLVGKTQIKGASWLPRQGVKGGNIVGNYYQGSQLIYGPIMESKSLLPKIPRDKRLYFKELLFGDLPQVDSLFISPREKELVKNSFDSEPKWIYSTGVITLTDMELEGNIIVKSDTLIRVSAFAKAKDILLIAPHIIIDSKVEGAFQAVASKSITVGIGATLKYPSSLAVIHDSKNIVAGRKSKEFIGIRIEEKSRVAGVVMYLDDSTTKHQKPTLEIDKDVEIRGDVYVEGGVELRGRVLGSVYANNFSAQERGSIYQNHIFNGEVDARGLPKRFAGLFTASHSKEVVKWLD